MIYLIAILGLVVGSFLNVVIVRYPEMLRRHWRKDCLEFLEQPAEPEKTAFNLIIPRSQCPHCQHTLAIWHNIPLLSYCWLRGRCAYCQHSLSLLYPIVELLCALTTVAVFLHFGLTLQGIAACLLTWGLIALAGIDWRIQILPDTLTLSLLWLGLLFNLLHLFAPLSAAVCGAVVGYVFLWVIMQLFKWIRKKQGMGHGDFKMMAMFGAWLGVLPLLNIILVAVLISLMVNLILLGLKKISYNHPLPFGPSLAIGGWLTLVYGATVTNWISQWMGNH